MIYLDTSVLGALFFREQTAPAILARLETVGKDDLCVSAWNLAEMASVGAIKERTGSIDAAVRAAGLTAFNRLVSDSLRLAEVEPGDSVPPSCCWIRPRWLCVRAMFPTWPSSAAYGPTWRLWMRANRWPPITTASPFLGCLDLLGKRPLANGRLRPEAVRHRKAQRTLTGALIRPNTGLLRARRNRTVKHSLRLWSIRLLTFCLLVVDRVESRH